MLPRKPLKRMLKHDCPYQVSDDAVIALRNILETLAEDISHTAVEAFEDLNEKRTQLGIRQLQRLNEWAIVRAVENIFSSDSYYDMGLQSSRIVSPGGTHMSTETYATKSARDEGSDTGGA